MDVVESMAGGFSGHPPRGIADRRRPDHSIGAGAGTVLDLLSALADRAITADRRRILGPGHRRPPLFRGGEQSPGPRLERACSGRQETAVPGLSADPGGFPGTVRSRRIRRVSLESLRVSWRMCSDLASGPPEERARPPA